MRVCIVMGYASLILLFILVLDEGASRDGVTCPVNVLLCQLTFDFASRSGQSSAVKEVGEFSVTDRDRSSHQLRPDLELRNEAFLYNKMGVKAEYIESLNLMKTPVYTGGTLGEKIKNSKTFDVAKTYDDIKKVLETTHNVDGLSLGDPNMGNFMYEKPDGDMKAIDPGRGSDLGPLSETSILRSYLINLDNLLAAENYYGTVGEGITLCIYRSRLITDPL
jgi:hypothetical protein